MELYNGDCLEIMKSIPEHSIDMILTDPPYGTTACKWDSIIPFDKMWESINRVIKQDGAVLLFGSEPFSSALRMSNIKYYKYDWIWDKKSAGNFMCGKYQPLKTFENISVFGNSIPYYPQLEHGYKNRTKEKPTEQKSQFLRDVKSGMFIQTEKNKKGEDRYPNAIIEISKQSSECCQQKAFHPTQKPIRLLQYLIKTYTKEYETVLDFTMGSGSTGVACAYTDRNFIGIELDKTYFDIASKRIKEAQHDRNQMLFPV